mgnify:CR=1 FL=1
MKLLPFNDYDLKTPRILEALNEASRSLAELKGFANSIPNQHILINAITINEAKDSSAIENIVTTHDSIYKILTESGYKDESAKEVVDYRSAIWRGFEIIKEKEFISTNVLVELQGMIEHNKAGVRKNPGTKLVNSKTREVIYTPPQEEKEIRDLLKNLEDYINKTDDEVDPLIKMTLIHYQFESIHPFYDGNGRTGRILNVLYLVLQNKLSLPILYLSKYINSTKNEYYKCLYDMRVDDIYIKNYLLYMIRGVEYTSDFTLAFISKFRGAMENCKALLKKKNSKLYSEELVEYLFFDFYTKNEYLRNALSISRNTASKYLSELETIGILTSEQVGKEKIYKNNYLYELMKEW